MLALGHTGGEREGALDALGSLDTVVVLASNEGPLSAVASVQVPVASWAESFGSFVNGKGLFQSFTRAIPSPDGVETAWKTLVQVASALGHDLGYVRTGEVRDELTQSATAEAAAEPTATA